MVVFNRFYVVVFAKKFQIEQNCFSLFQLVFDCFMSFLGCCRSLCDVSFVLGCVTLLGFFRFFCGCKLCQHVWGRSDVSLVVVCGLFLGCLGCFGPPWDVLAVLGCLV